MLAELSQEHQMLRRTVGEMVDGLVASGASMGQVWNAFAELGMTGICSSEDLGGSDMDHLALGVAVQTVARRRPGWAAALAIHNLNPLLHMSKGELGPDLSEVAATCCRGEMMATATLPLCGPQTSRFLYADAEVPILLAKGQASHGGVDLVEFTAIKDTRAQLGFDDLRMGVNGDEGSAIGRLSLGQGEAHACVVKGVLGALAVGIGLGAFQAMSAYASERMQFGKPLNAFQAIQWMLADSNAELDAAELLVQRALTPETMKAEHSAAAALVAAETAIRVSDRAIQVHGGYGFTREYSPQRYWRAAHQLQKTLLASAVFDAQIVSNAVLETGC